jgi:hypothetical protein
MIKLAVQPPNVCAPLSLGDLAGPNRPCFRCTGRVSVRTFKEPASPTATHFQSRTSTSARPQRCATYSTTSKEKLIMPHVQTADEILGAIKRIDPDDPQLDVQIQDRLKPAN